MCDGCRAPRECAVFPPFHFIDAHFTMKIAISDCAYSHKFSSHWKLSIILLHCFEDPCWAPRNVSMADASDFANRVLQAVCVLGSPQASQQQKHDANTVLAQVWHHRNLIRTKRFLTPNWVLFANFSQLNLFAIELWSYLAFINEFLIHFVALSYLKTRSGELFSVSLTWNSCCTIEGKLWY